MPLTCPAAPELIRKLPIPVKATLLNACVTLLFPGLTTRELSSRKIPSPQRISATVSGSSNAKIGLGHDCKIRTDVRDREAPPTVDPAAPFMARPIGSSVNAGPASASGSLSPATAQSVTTNALRRFTVEEAGAPHLWAQLVEPFF